MKLLKTAFGHRIATAMMALYRHFSRRLSTSSSAGIQSAFVRFTGVSLVVSIGLVSPAPDANAQKPPSGTPGSAVLAQSGKGLPSIGPRADYVTSTACIECHPKEHSSWHRSFHRTMTQVARPGIVAGTFDGTQVVSDGLKYKVFTRGAELRALMPDPDVMMYVVQGGKKVPLSQIPQVDVPVVMATGSHHYQTYWVASPRYEGLLQTLPLVYLIEDQRWAPREAAFLRGPADQGHLTTQWNHHCIRCHSTAGNPGLDEATGMLKSKAAELGIACEACHGPGKEHVDKQWDLRRAPSALASKPESRDPTIVNPAHLDPKRSSQVCGQCHGVYIDRDEFAMQFAREGPLYRPGDDLDRTRYYIQHPTSDPSPARRTEFKRNQDFFQERWWDDGTILAGGREFTAMMASACYRKGELSCVSCHSMHRSDPVDQLKPDMAGSPACIQCHREPRYTTQRGQHTLHKVNSEGSNCLNCHMPYTTYALFKAIRSHQISSPRVASSARFGTPNACNLCHLDKTLAWTQQELTRFRPLEPVVLSDEQGNTAASLLWMLKGNAAQRVIAAWHAGWPPAQAASGRDWLAPHTAQLLRDSYGVVRYVAARSLRTLPGFESFQFDFLAAESVLAERSQEAVRVWESRPAGLRSPLHVGNATLIGPDGALMKAKLNALLREQDTRSVTIKE